jgi:hypothetical protein
MVDWERLRGDASSLQALTAANPRHLALVERAPDLRRFVVRTALDAPVVAGDGYRIAPEHDMVIEIPDNYLATNGAGQFVKSRIKRHGERLFHPNCWPNDGCLCYDSQFYPEKSLADQFMTVINLMQLRAINHDSPADWDADYFYLHHRDEVRARIRPVMLVLPRGGVRLRPRSLPRVS